MSPRLPMNSQPGLPTSNSHERRDAVSTRSGSDGVERSEFQAALAGDRAATPSASDSFTRSIRAYRFAPPGYQLRCLRCRGVWFSFCCLLPTGLEQQVANLQVTTIFGPAGCVGSNLC